MEFGVLDYKIVTAQSAEELQNAVMSWISKGYLTAGGLVATCADGEEKPAFYQAVVLARGSRAKTLVMELEGAGFQVNPINGVNRRNDAEPESTSEWSELKKKYEIR